MTTDPKFCVQCTHYRKPWYMPASLARCAAVYMHGDTLTLVDGRPKQFSFCQNQRSFPAGDVTCGSEGRFFERKE